MAEVQTLKLFYEFLVRGDDNGRPAGAHIQFRDVVKVDGVTLKDEPGPALPVTELSKSGSEAEKIALVDAVGEVVVALTEALEVERSNLAAKTAELTASQANNQILLGKAADAEAKAAELEAKLAGNPLVVLATAIRDVFKPAAEPV